MLGPAEAPLALIKGRYRFPAAGEVGAQLGPLGLFARWLAAGPKTKGNLKLEVDIDPQSFL